MSPARDGGVVVRNISDHQSKEKLARYDCSPWQIMLDWYISSGWKYIVWKWGRYKLEGKLFWDGGRSWDIRWYGTYSCCYYWLFELLPMHVFYLKEIGVLLFLMECFRCLNIWRGDEWEDVWWYDGMMFLCCRIEKDYFVRSVDGYFLGYHLD